MGMDSCAGASVVSNTVLCDVVKTIRAGLASDGPLFIPEQPLLRAIQLSHRRPHRRLSRCLAALWGSIVRHIAAEEGITGRLEGIVCTLTAFYICIA